MGSWRQTTSVALLSVLLPIAACALGSTERRLDEGDDLYEKGDLDGAAEIYARVLESDPDNARALHALSVVHYTRGEYRPALTLLDRAVRLDEDNAAYLLQRGDTSLRLGSYHRAIEDYQAAIRLDPSLVQAHYSIGIAYYNAHEYGDAVRWLERYLEVAPNADDRDKVEQLIRSLRDWS